MFRLLIVVPLALAAPRQYPNWNGAQPGSANADGSSLDTSQPWFSYNTQQYPPQNSLTSQNRNFNVWQYGEDPNYVDPNEGMSSNLEQQQYFRQEARNNGQQTDDYDSGFFNQAYNLLKNGGSSLYGSLSLDEILNNVVEAVQSRVDNN